MGWGSPCDWVMEAASSHGELAMGSQQQAAQLEKHSKSTRFSLAAGVQHRHEKASSQMKAQPRCETAIIA